MDDLKWEAFSRRLFDQNRFAVKLGLENIRRAFEAEGDPQEASPAIIVGGTNGKGETAATTAAILQAHGLKVGLYTSPHLIEARERFRVQGHPLEREVVSGTGRRLLDRYSAPVDDDPALTFFELTTLMSAILFRDTAVDVGIYEVGLGGRLDAVNAIEPALTIVTNVDFDHQRYLGETIDEIASEKAALFRQDVPAVIGQQFHERAEARLRSAAPWAVKAGSDPGMAPQTGPQPATRRANMACARAAAELFLGSDLRGEAMKIGLRRARWPGRMERRRLHVEGRKYDVFLDAAHNEGGARSLFEHIDTHRLQFGAVVCGGMADKPLREMFRPLETLDVPVFGAEVCSERAADASELAEVIPASVFREAVPAADALRLAASESGERPILVFGSIYLLGEVLAAGGVEASDLVTFD